VAKALRPRVFVSCGQRKGSEELTIANRIAARLKSMGFDPYVATEEQTLKGIIENVLARLAESEYFLFVDFRRERLSPKHRRPRSGRAAFRGSLFSHQELGVATFLELGFLGFQEAGVRPDDGMIGFVQGNVYPFRPRERPELPEIVANRVRTRLDSGEWRIGWRRQLEIRHDPQLTSIASDQQLGGVGSTYLHFVIRNLDSRASAYDCVAYVTEIRLVGSGVVRPLPRVELKFHGVVSQSVVVPRSDQRQLAAVRILHTEPLVALVGFNSLITDFSGFFNEFAMRERGDYDLRVKVFSRNFPALDQWFRFHLGATPAECSLTPLKQYLPVTNGQSRTQ
jgi:hypothetical protein